MQRQSGIEEKMKKAKADEAAMLKAVQELRQTILKDERELQITAQCVQVTLTRVVSVRWGNFDHLRA